MKILLTHRYFWPDTAPYAVMLRTIADDLANAGHDVRVFASVPSYRGAQGAPRSETLGQVKVRRVWVFAERKGNMPLRIANVLIYCIALFFHILRQRPDVVTAATFPPVVAGLSASLAARIVGAKFIYHMQDVHPDVSVYAGGRMGRAPFVGMMRWLDGIARRSAAAIVVLSQDMRRTVVDGTSGALPEIAIINNLALDTFAANDAAPENLRKPDGVRRVIFAGNLGWFQNLPLLAEGAVQAISGTPDTELLFLGDGDALADLTARWGDHPQVRFGPFLPFAQARGLIAGADVGLVSLSADIYRVSYPSKVLTYIGLGLPMLALVEPDSQLAQTITDEKLGVVPAAPTPDAIAKALGDLLAEPDLRPHVQAYHARAVDQPIILGKWRHLIAQVGDV